MIFEKYIVVLKFSRNVHLAPYDIRGAANGRLYWPVGQGSCRRGARRQES
jgi:hypothetical protein